MVASPILLLIGMPIRILSVGAAVADAFFGSIWFSLGPVFVFAIFHFNVIMYIRRRNRFVKERDEKVKFLKFYVNPPHKTEVQHPNKTYWGIGEEFLWQKF